MIVFYLDQLGQCHQRAPDQVLSKMGQNSLKLCKKWDSKMEASKLVENSGAPSGSGRGQDLDTTGPI